MPITIDHITARLRRLAHWQYLRLYCQIYFDATMVRRRLQELANYHAGAEMDFRPARERLLRRLLTYAARHSPFYRELFCRCGIDLDDWAQVSRRWSSIPLLDKSIIRENRARIMTFSETEDFLGYITTGGSTGQPFGFHYYGGHDAAHQAFFFALMGYRPGDRILALDGTLVREDLVANGIYWTRKAQTDLPYGSMSLSSHYLTRETSNAYIEFLESFRPAIIRGYPSFVAKLAEYISLRGKQLSFTPKGIQLTSESYTDQQASAIESAFSCKVFGQYGHAECCVFGYTGGLGTTIYCSPFYGYTEVLDDSGRHVAVGEIGEVVTTGFNNHALPFIRYRTGDLAVYGGEESGIVKLNAVFGRTQDIIYTREMDEVRLTAIIFGRHYQALGRIRQWQLVQTVPGAVVFRIIPTEEFCQRDRDEIHTAFRDLAQIAVSFEVVDQLTRTPRGKSRLLIQTINKQVSSAEISAL